MTILFWLICTFAIICSSFSLYNSFKAFRNAEKFEKNMKAISSNIVWPRYNGYGYQPVSTANMPPPPKSR